MTSFMDDPFNVSNLFLSGKFGRVLKCRHREENADVYYAAKFVLCSKREGLNFTKILQAAFLTGGRDKVEIYKVDKCF